MDSASLRPQRSGANSVAICYNKFFALSIAFFFLRKLNGLGSPRGLPRGVVTRRRVELLFAA